MIGSVIEIKSNQSAGSRRGLGTQRFAAIKQFEPTHRALELGSTQLHVDQIMLAAKPKSELLAAIQLGWLFSNRVAEV